MLPLLGLPARAQKEAKLGEENCVYCDEELKQLH